MIEFNNVSKTYENGTRALRGVNLRIEQGEFVFIVGDSGAGKTTLTKLLMCEERLTSGQLKINGYNLSRIPRRKIPFLRRTIGMVFQDFRLLPNMTAAENVAFAMRVIGEPKKLINTRVKKFLTLVGLGDKMDCFPRELSGGEKQRVALARTLNQSPSIILADEPVASLDPIMADVVMNDFLRINQDMNITILLNIHHVDLALKYATRVIGIRAGQIVYDGPTAAVTQDILDQVYNGKPIPKSTDKEEPVA